MSRKTTLLQTVGGFFHVFNRGVNRQELFLHSSEYAFFVGLMARALSNAPINLHAYCLMPNHYHLIVEQTEAYAVSSFVKHVCEPFAKRQNMVHHRKGHYFEERYRMRLIEDPLYLLNISRYVHFNPVKARLSENPAQWPHSSCAEYLGLRPPTFVTTGTILGLAGGTEDYAGYLCEGGTPYGDEMEKYALEWEP